MAVTIRNLRLYTQIVQTKSFTAVAEKNYLTQSALSRMIISIEKELDVCLIDRTTRHFELTPEGRMYYQYACRVVTEHDRALKEIRSLKNTRSLRVGYNPVSGPPAFLIRALERLHDRCPEVYIALIRGHSGELVDMLDDGSLDCALVSTYYVQNPDRYLIRPMQQINLYALLRRDSPLNREGQMRLEELEGQQIIFMTATAPHTRREFYNIFPDASRHIWEAPPAETLEDMLSSVRINHIIGISSVSNRDGQYTDVVARLLHRDESETQGHGGRALVSRRDQQKEAVTMLSQVLEEMRETSAGSVFPFNS